MTRILAVDPGEKRLGLAISDATGTIASPLTTIEHISRKMDAARVAKIADEAQATAIIIGHALNSDGLPGPQARRADRFAEEVRNQTTLPVILWDESGSTQFARAAMAEMKVTKRKRKRHLDELAATVILQSFLDAKSG
jgi:putative Holliday junction resolvase